MWVTFKHHSLWLFSIEGQKGKVLVTKVQEQVTVIRMISDKAQGCSRLSGYPV